MHDVIVVGARCAGAATARLLAQKGYRTLLVDRSSFPSDMPMSTHLLWHSGAAQLARWGLLDAVKATGCPACTEVSLDLGAFKLVGSPASADVHEAFAPRRKVLDQIILEAAIAAGVEFRESFMVDDVSWEDGRVVGIRGAARDASAESLPATLVVGADGRASRVARAVSAPIYNELPALEGIRFAYFSDVPVTILEFVPGMRRMAFAWPTNDDLVLVGIAFAIDDFVKTRADIEDDFYAELGKCAPDLAARVRGGKRESAWVGGAIESFVRKPFGPGWALVGDAGLTLDPITAAGITDAFRDAQLLADAIDEGLSGRRDLADALGQFEQRRNEVSLPLFHFAAQMAQLAPPPPEIMQLFSALQYNQADTNRYFGVFAQTVPVTEFFDPANLERIIMQAGGVRPDAMA